MSRYFSWARFWAVLMKEFVQMRRDRLTFAMIVGIPIIQLILFGFAINTDPKALPTAVLAADHSVFARSFVRAMENSGYFRVSRNVATEAQAERALAEGEVQFVLTIPENFSRKLVRGERPVLLLEAETTPSLTSVFALVKLPPARSMVPSARFVRVDPVSNSAPKRLNVPAFRIVTALTTRRATIWG